MNLLVLIFQLTVVLLYCAFLLQALYLRFGLLGIFVVVVVVNDCVF